MTKREFLTDEVWKSWKIDFDRLLSFRHSIKGTPDEYQRALIDLYRPWIAFYKAVL